MRRSDWPWAARRAALALLLAAVLAPPAPSFASFDFTVDRGLGSEPLAALTATTFTVNSAANGPDITVGNGICETATGNGICTLRAAVQESNASVGDKDTIEFSIGTGAVQILNPALPQITDPVVVDATTQPGYSGSPLIELRGPTPIANQSSGVFVTAGDTTLRGFVINRYQYGVRFEVGDGNHLEGSWLGLNGSGVQETGISNTSNGVFITNLSDFNTIGGTGPGDGNVISVSGSHGIAMQTAVTVVQGNLIGLTATGTAAAPNGTDGIHITGPFNTIGGTDPGARNVISGQGGSEGVDIAAGNDNIVLGNYIGTNAAGTAAIPNGNGVGVHNAPDTTIGGSAIGSRNVISGNNNAGVEVLGTSTGVTVQGNYIGVDVDGIARLANAGANNGDGVTINVTNADAMIGGDIGTTPGGSCTGACNVISGNNSHGIDTLSATTIKGNYLGVAANGTTPRPNGGHGLNATGSGHTVGGATPESRNVMSGNNTLGAYMFASNSVIQGNYFGTTSDGMTALPNGLLGASYSIGLTVGGGSNTIGGTTGVTPGGPCTGACNLFAGEVIGLNVAGNDNTVQGNFMGVQPDGSGAIPNTTGLYVPGPSNLIGGTTPAARNVFSGNTGWGISVFNSGSTSQNNWIQGNYIGVEPDGVTPLPNNTGIRLDNGALGTTIGGSADGANVIAHNATDGIYISQASRASQRIMINSIHSNGQLGIDIATDGVSPNDNLDGDVFINGQDLQNFPVLSAASAGANDTIVGGTLHSKANQTFELHFYANDACDPSGNGEGQRYLGSGSVTTDGAGNGSFNLNLPTPLQSDTVITATATNSIFSTSEFSNCMDARYSRPQGAVQLRVPLVIAYDECQPGSANRTHGPSLEHPSCNPRVQSSEWLTVGTFDANGKPTQSNGSVALTVCPTGTTGTGSCATPAGMSAPDVRIAVGLTDVRCRNLPTQQGGCPGPSATLNDYTGEVGLRATVRLTDRHNGPATNEAATVVEHPLAVTLGCNSTAEPPDIGASCSIETRMSAVNPGAVVSGKRMNWELGQIELYDGGFDGLVSTADNEPLARQGIFVP